MPAKQNVSPETVTKLVEQNATAMRNLKGQLQRMQEQIASVQARQSEPGFVHASPSQGSFQAQGPSFPTLAQAPPTQIGSPGAAPFPTLSEAPSQIGQPYQASRFERSRIGPWIGQGSFAQLPQSSQQFGPSSPQVPQQASLPFGQLGPQFGQTTPQVGQVSQIPEQTRAGPRTGEISPFETLASEGFTQMARDKQNIPPVTRQPTIDLIDDEDSFVLEADIPGVSKSDLDLTVYGNTLTIQAEAEPGTGEGAVLVGERLPTVFRRTLRLPAEVKPEEVKANLQNGILTVTLPKQETGGGPHRIEIK